MADIKTSNLKTTTTPPRELFCPVEKEQVLVQENLRSNRSYWQDAWLRFRKNKLAMVGMVILIFMILFAIVGPLFSPYDIREMKGATNQWPSSEHWFGTDSMGRDLFIRCIYGLRISLTVGFAAAFVNMFIGVIYGGIAGYFGGKADMLMMSICQILYSLPQICYVILIMAFMDSNGTGGNGIGTVLLSISVIYWIKTARVVRNEVMRIKHEDFVLAAHVTGESSARIIRKHLIPNCMGSIIVSVTFLIPEAIFLEAFLSFLGIGISVPQASLGTLTNSARGTFMNYPYQLLFPALLISITMFALNFVGDGLRDALDPKMN